MLLLIKIEIKKISKSKLFIAWLVTIFIVLGITGIIIMGLGTDNKLGEFVGQGTNEDRITGKWEGWAIAASLFSALFTKAAFLIFESYLLSSIIIDEFKRKTSLIKLVAVLTESNYILVANQLINLAGITFGIVLIGVLPFVLGMIRYSTPITMLSGLGLAALLSNVTPGNLTNNFVDNSLFLIFTSLISLIIVSFSIYNISREDIKIK